MYKKKQEVQIIKNRLCWVSDIQPPKNLAKSFYFNIDSDLVYDSFNQDFGPLSLGKTYRFTKELQKLLAHPEYRSCQIIHYTSIQPDKTANAAYLICAFQMISLGRTAKQTFEPFKNINLKPFRDAGYLECTYKCTLLDCLSGLEYAMMLGWFDYKTFNLAEYEHYERVQNGDLNWVIPKKFIAFSSPSQKPIDKYGNRTYTPQDYIPIFRKLGVTSVVRLNNKTYDNSDFVKNNVNHHELYFADGSVPSLDIVHDFLQLAEKQVGAFAVHCKAGLGRTGTLIGCFAMKHYYFPAADFIGWIRICRPGSILGPQQNFLIEVQKQMREEGVKSPIWKEVRQLVDEREVISRMKSVSLQEMNKRQKDIMANGQQGQGEGLVQAKMRKNNQLREKASSTYSKSSNSTANKNGSVVVITLIQKK